MAVELIDISECKKNLDIEIPMDAVDQQIAGVAREFARRARVPGFRPGKAPLNVVKARYRDEIRSEVLQHLLPKYFSEAAKERELDLVGAPHFEKIDYVEGQPLRFKAVFEVYPQLNITNYEGISAEEISTAVDDSEIDAALGRLQEDFSELTPVEENREIRLGDFAQITLEGTIVGSEKPTISGEKATCEIGGRTTLQEFTDNLKGARAGEERAFQVSYRGDSPEKSLAGKTIDYKVKVEALQEKKVPDINDEFAQGLGDYKTLDELKAKIRQDLEKNKQESAEELKRERILQWLEDNNTFEVPDTLVEIQLDTRLRRLVRDLARRGINPQRLDVDWGKIRQEQHQHAIRDVKGSLILEYISEREDIQASDDEVEAEIKKIAEQTKRSTESVRHALSHDQGLGRIKGQIRNRKTLDLLAERSHIKKP